MVLRYLERRKFRAFVTVFPTRDARLVGRDLH